MPGGIFSVALALIPSLMSSFFLSRAPRRLPPSLGLRQLRLRLPGHCASLSSSPSPPLEDLLAAVASESFSKGSFQISSAEGPPGPAPSLTLRMNPETGNSRSPQLRDLQTGCAACLWGLRLPTGLLLEPSLCAPPAKEPPLAFSNSEKPQG